MKRLAVVLSVVAVLLSGCVLYPGQVFNPDQNIDNLGGARFSQSQAVQGFDTSTYTLSDDTLEQFRDILRAHDIDPGDYRGPDVEGCTGGITTRVQMWFHGNGDKEMIVGGCGAADGSFEQEATAFFSSIREGEGPAPTLLSVTFTQTQAVPGFDTGPFVQDDPVQLARVTAILDEYGVVPGQYDIDPEPCPGSISSDVTFEYAGMGIAPVLLLDSCTDDGGFSEQTTALLSEWRESLASG